MSDKPAIYKVFEVYGRQASREGWDFLVCKTMDEALEMVWMDMDELDPNPEAEDEVRIVSRRYTQEQMDEVIYER